ncbi:MAG: PHP domain-containing protein [bacterium]
MNRVEADLHLHTSCSDGAHTPEAVVLLAKQKGLGGIALTDHDTVGGLAEARAASDRAGLVFVNGIEMTCRCEGRDIHILGYFFDESNEQLRASLTRFRERREERGREMVAKLNALGVEISFADVTKISGAAPVGRPHVARVLVASGAVKSVDDAFRRYLHDDGPAFAPASTLSAADAIALIRAAGGIASIAHPVLYRGRPTAETLVQVLADEGVSALEVWHPKHGPDDTQRLVDLAKKYRLVETGGSDFHALAYGTVAPGDAGVSLEAVERLRALAG